MKNDDLIYEHILKPIQTDRRVWIAGGIALALILIVALWPSKTEVVKAVVKHEAMVQVEAAKETIAEKVEAAKETIAEKVEAAKERVDTIVLAKDLTFYDNLISTDERATLNKYYSKTKEASASTYASLYSIADPDDTTPNSIEIFFRKAINYTLNDSDTPGLITEREARWIHMLYDAQRGHIAKEHFQGTKDKLKDMFSD